MIVKERVSAQDFFEIRRLSYEPSHLATIDLSHTYNIESAISKWIDTNLKKRYFLKKVIGLTKENKTFDFLIYNGPNTIDGSLKKQIVRVLEKKFDKNNIIIAYEPIWSIGTGKIPTVSELKKTTSFIKKTLKNVFKTKNSPAVLYGGSVDGSNVALFKDIPDIDGFLIGGASKSSKKFIDILKNYYR